MLSVKLTVKGIVPEGLKVFVTQSPSPSFGIAKSYKTMPFGVVFRHDILAPVYGRFSGMVLTNVFRLSRQFKVLYSIVGLYVVHVMNFLTRCQRSAKMLFHDVAMMQNSFTIYVYTQIAKWGKKWLTFLKVIPVRRYVIGLVPKPSAPMRLANLSTSFTEYIGATFNSAYFTIHYPNRNTL